MKATAQTNRTHTVAILISALALVFCAGLQDRSAAADDALVVQVNGVKLTESALAENINRTIAPLAKQIPADKLDDFKKQMRQKFIDDFITRTLVQQEADKHKLTVADADVDAAISDMKKNLPAGINLEDALKMNGISMDKMKQDIRFGLLYNKLVESQVQDAEQPSEKEIQDYYTRNKKKFDEPEKVHARHILIKTASTDDEKTKAEKKKNIEALRAQLLAGADFAKVAQEHSECPSSQKGGDLGSFTRGRMVKPFEDAAFSQEVNAIGPIVETQFGYHIIQVTEHTQATPGTIENVHEKIAKRLQQQKKQGKIKDYIESLKAAATITYGSSKG